MNETAVGCTCGPSAPYDSHDWDCPMNPQNWQAPMSAVRELLSRWDASTNPIFLAAAGQLRLALRKDGRNDVAEVPRVTSE